MQVKMKNKQNINSEVAIGLSRVAYQRISVVISFLDNARELWQI